MSLPGIMDALAAQIADELSSIDDLQVVGRMMWNPTPPAIDIYPAEDVFQETISYARGKAVTFTVRARVNTPDREGAQELLLSLMDVEAAESVEAAILSDRTLGGAVDDLRVDGPTGFTVFVDPAGDALLGCSWAVTVLP